MNRKLATRALAWRLALFSENCSGTCPVPPCSGSSRFNSVSCLEFRWNTDAFIQVSRGLHDSPRFVSPVERVVGTSWAREKGSRAGTEDERQHPASSTTEKAAKSPRASHGWTYEEVVTAPNALSMARLISGPVIASWILSGQVRSIHKASVHTGFVLVHPIHGWKCI